MSSMGSAVSGTTLQNFMDAVGVSPTEESTMLPTAKSDDGGRKPPVPHSASAHAPVAQPSVAQAPVAQAPVARAQAPRTQAVAQAPAMQPKAKDPPKPHRELPQVKLESPRSPKVGFPWKAGQCTTHVCSFTTIWSAVDRLLRAGDCVVAMRRVRTC